MMSDLFVLETSIELKFHEIEGSKHGSINKVPSKFGVGTQRLSVSRFWNVTRKQYIAAILGADVISKQKSIYGRNYVD